MSYRCPYCKNERTGGGWHDCPQAIKAKQKLDAVLGAIHMDYKLPGSSPQTSAEMKNREDSRHQIATRLKSMGHSVNPDYS